MEKSLRTNFTRRVLGKFVLGAGFFMLPLCALVAAPAGHDYRSVQTGNWNQVSSWERRAFGSGNSWVPVTLAADIPDATAGTIFVRSGHTISLTSDLTADQLTVHAGGILNVNSGVTLTIADNISDAVDFSVAGPSATSQGVVVNAGNIVAAPNAVINFAGTSIYRHNYTTTFGAIPVAAWSITSTLEFIGFTTNPAGTPSGFDQMFGNIRWNTPNLATDLALNGALTSNVRGNFEVVSTNGKAVNLGGDAPYTLIVQGNLDVSNNSVLSISNGTLSTATSKLTLNGNLNVAAGAVLTSNNSASPSNITFGAAGQSLNGTGVINTSNIDILVNGASVLNMNRDLTMASGRTLTVGGRLNMGSYVIGGPGNFTLNAVGTLGVGSPQGITAGTTLAGNVQVTGTRLYRVATYVYNGTVAQVTGDGLPTNIDVFQIDNPAGVTLSAHLNLNDQLVLTNGKVKTGATNRLTVKNTATITYPASEVLSFIEGPIRIMVVGFNPVITFPIGNGTTYSPITLDAIQYSISDPTIYEAEEFRTAAPVYPFNGQQTGTNTIDRVSQVRYYKVFSYSQNFDMGIIKLPVSSEDFVNNFSDLVVAGVEGNTWYNLENTGVTGTVINGFITSDYIFALGEFALANRIGGSNPLPVSLKAFTARRQEKAVVLNWMTATEKNNAFFEVERSQDGRSFEKIAEVAGAGSSNTARNYQVLDENPLGGISYYRLKQVDLDGTATFSEIVSVASPALKAKVMLYPNPVQNRLQVELNSGSAAILRVVNVLGQEVMKRSVTAGAQKAGLDVKDLPAGAYQLIIEQEGSRTAEKFLKVNN